MSSHSRDRSVLTSIWRLIRAPLSTRDWTIILITDQTLDEVIDPESTIPDGLHLRCPSWLRFWADPCVVVDENGSVWIFIEEFHRWQGTGCIAALEVRGGELRRRVSVLEGPHHRAFPRVWRHEGRWLATVDGCEAPPVIYQFEELGDAWQPAVGPQLPAHLTDPAVGLTDFVTQLVGTNFRTDESSDVEVWSTRDSNLDRWERNPELCYRNGALGRGAGNVDLVRGVRAVQDGIEAYGIAVSLIVWPVTDHAPRILRRIEGRDLGGFTGTHTLSWSADGQVVVADAWRRRFDPLGWMWKLRDLRHMKACRTNAHLPQLSEK